MILCFSILGAFDWLIGNKIGVGKEFERAFSLFAPMALSMLGMIVKGVVLNSAFAVSASFVFGSHLAFTMAFDDSYTIPMILAKIIAGILAVIFALLIYREKSSQKS